LLTEREAVEKMIGSWSQRKPGSMPEA